MKLAATIHQQIQPTDKCCLPTCIAMALGLPITEIGVDLEQDYDAEEFGPWLAERGIWLRIADRGERMSAAGLYLVGVVSKNDLGEMHSLLLDTRNGARLLFDPNTGKEGKNTYAALDEDQDVIDFCELVERGQDTAGNARTDDAGVQPGAPIKAAGILFLAPQNMGLFLLRGRGGDYPLHWCFPGGQTEGDETAEETAIREAVEELGELGTLSLKPLSRTMTPGQPMVIGEPLAPGQAAPNAEVDFTTFVQLAKSEFTPKISDESLGFAWAPIDTPPQPLHPGCQIALQRVTMNELDIARAIAAGTLTSPQRYENMWLFALRITGTGVAYRTKINEWVWRKPEHYLNEEFLARSNGLPVIWAHPPKKILDTESFRERNIGAIMLPYLKGDEVWGVARISDLEAAELMQKIGPDGNPMFSTSPGVLLGGASDKDVRVTTDAGQTVLIEGALRLLDHLAVCYLGVWDKNGPPQGVQVDSQDRQQETLERDRTAIRRMAQAVRVMEVADYCRKLGF